MKYVVFLNDTEVEVEVKGDKVVLGGKEHHVRLLSLPNTPRRQLIMEDSCRELGMKYGEGAWLVHQEGMRWEVVVKDERTRNLEAITGGAGGRVRDGVIKAPMPGLVLRVMVSVGEPVRPDTPLLVLEAMKMENELRAGRAGVVESVRVSSGDAVEKGAPLVEIRAGA